MHMIKEIHHLHMARDIMLTCNTQFRICAPRQKQPQRFSPVKSYKIHISPLDFWFNATCPVILIMSNEHGNAQTKPHKANQNIKYAWKFFLHVFWKVSGHNEWVYELFHLECRDRFSSKQKIIKITYSAIYLKTLS